MDYRPPGQPHFGGVIERLIGTMMTMVHELPGTTFSNTADRTTGVMFPHAASRSATRPRVNSGEPVGGFGGDRDGDQRPFGHACRFPLARSSSTNGSASSLRRVIAPHTGSRGRRRTGRPTNRSFASSCNFESR
ncbi:hypothetical protein ACWEVD_23545 [Nocardia thailandica]